MTTLRATIDIDAPTDKVWEAIKDFGNIHRFNPSIPRSHLTSDQEHGVGTTRHCDFNVAGASVRERITDWQEGRSYSVDIYEKSRIPFLKNITGHVAVEPSPRGSTGIFEMGYETSAGPIGRLMERMLRKRNAKATKLFVAGLKHYVETGEDVTQGVRVDTNAAVLVEA